jgi:hypothetical protein
MAPSCKVHTSLTMLSPSYASLPTRDTPEDLWICSDSLAWTMVIRDTCFHSSRDISMKRRNQSSFNHSPFVVFGRLQNVPLSLNPLLHISDVWKIYSFPMQNPMTTLLVMLKIRSGMYCLHFLETMLGLILSAWICSPSLWL